MQFRSLSKTDTFPQIEEKILSLWDADGSFAKCLQKDGIDKFNEACRGTVLNGRFERMCIIYDVGESLPLAPTALQT